MTAHSIAARTALGFALAVLPAASPAQVVLDFEFVGPGQQDQPIGSYYGGGLSGGPNPVGPGPALGVTFTSNAVVACRATIPGCFATIAGAPSPRGVLYIATGTTSRRVRRPP